MRRLLLDPDQRIRSTIAGAAVCALAIGIGISVGVHSATATSEAESGPDPDSVISLLDDKAQALPPGVATTALGDGGLDTASFHKLGEEGAKSFWTGLDKAGNICLVAILDVRMTTAATCSKPQQVEDRGLDLTAAGDNHAADYDPVVAVLVPDSVSLDSPATETIAEDAASTGPSPFTEARSRLKPGNSVKNPWRTHGSNLVVARQSEIPINVKFQFSRKRGHAGAKINVHG